MERIETRGRPRSGAHDSVSEDLLTKIESDIGKPVIQAKSDNLKKRNREGSLKAFKAYRVSVSYQELRKALEEQGYRVSLFFSTDHSAALRALKK